MGVAENWPARWIVVLVGPPGKIYVPGFLCAEEFGSYELAQAAWSQRRGMFSPDLRPIAFQVDGIDSPEWKWLE